MLKRIDLSPPRGHELFAEATPLGLIGLAVGCAALTPIAFGYCMTPAGLKTAAMYCLLFGAGGQFLAGMMNFANKNLYGGTLFTAFAFSWLMNYWALAGLAEKAPPDGGVILATEILFLVIFVVLTYGFGFYSKLLFLFLLDIDLLFICKIGNAVLGTTALNVPIAIFTVGLGLIALWIAFAMMINPTAGRAVFPIAGPMFVAPPKPAFDMSLRQAIATALYAQWQQHGFAPLSVAELEQQVQEQAQGRPLLPDLLYLKERGFLTTAPANGHAGSAAADPTSLDQVDAVRLTADGIDVHEQLALQKYAA